MGRVRKKKKRNDDEGGGGGGEAEEPSTSSDESEVTAEDKYSPFRVPNYKRFYQEDGGNFEYIVFLESTDPNKPIGMRDMMSLSTAIKRFNKGVKQLQRINKMKVGVIFERPTLANAALTNKKFLDGYKLSATIPAAATEVTGVITHVPPEMSNQAIYSNLSNTRNVVSIRRFMRKSIDDNKVVTFVPTKTVSITFSCPQLPESVDLNSWRFELRPYIPPVKQCLKCLRYGHIAKFCKNSECCSICGESHNFKDCPTPKTPTCWHCKGKHIAISADCPVKKEKIEKNKAQAQGKTYSYVLNEKSFPSLKQNPTALLASLLNSEQILNLVVESVVKLITLNKNNEASICTKSIKEILLDTIQNKK